MNLFTTRHIETQIGLRVPEVSLLKLQKYLSLLKKWGRSFNLTAIHDAQEQFNYLILDSLVVHPFIHGERVLDIGAGSGVPGIPLACIAPNQQWTLLDSNGKKTRFLTQSAYELGLDNVDVVQSRVEQFTTEKSFTTIISRAFSSLANMIELSHHLLSPDGRFVTMKGERIEDEIKHIPDGFELDAVHQIDVPGIPTPRHVVIVKRGSHGG